MKKKKQNKECKHIWNSQMLCGTNDGYIYRLCVKCGLTERAKLTFRNYNAK